MRHAQKMLYFVYYELVLIYSYVLKTPLAKQRE